MALSLLCSSSADRWKRGHRLCLTMLVIWENPTMNIFFLGQFCRITWGVGRNRTWWVTFDIPRHFHNNLFDGGLAKPEIEYVKGFAVYLTFNPQRFAFRHPTLSNVNFTAPNGRCHGIILRFLVVCSLFSPSPWASSCILHGIFSKQPFIVVVVNILSSVFGICGCCFCCCFRFIHIRPVLWL